MLADQACEDMDGTMGRPAPGRREAGETAVGLYQMCLLALDLHSNARARATVFPDAWMSAHEPKNVQSKLLSVNESISVGKYARTMHR